MSYENWKNKAQGFQTVDVRLVSIYPSVVICTFGMLILLSFYS